MYDSNQLMPTPGTYTHNGIGSPSVVHRRRYNDYVMFFETRVTAPDADCIAGRWAVGVARSTDGKSWTVAPTPLVVPQAGSYHACVVAHPYAVIDENGRDIHLWFKGEQGVQACNNQNKPWGCSTYTGVGYAKVSRNLQTLLQTVSEPVLQVDNFGYPAVVHKDGTWYMMVAKVPSFYLATSSQPDSGWSLAQPSPVMQPGVTTWAQDELFNPSLVCADEGSFPFHNYFGGRNKWRWKILDGGWGSALSSDATSWFVAAQAYFQFNGPSPWRHWDTIRVGTNDTLVWFSEKTNGVNHIGFAGTTDTWVDSDVKSRLCPEPAWWSVVPGDGTLGGATQDLRELFDDVIADLNTPECVSGRIEDEVQPQIDDAFGEILKGHADHYGDEVVELIEELDEIEGECSFDTDALKGQVASVGLLALEQLIDRVESVSGPGDPDLIQAIADHAAAIAAYEVGDYLAAAEHAKDGAERVDGPSYVGNFCPAYALVEPYHVGLCALQQAVDLVDVLWQVTGDGDVSSALDKLEEGVRFAAVTDIHKVSHALEETLKKLSESPLDTSAEQAAVADAGSLLVRQMMDDAILSGHVSAGDLTNAEAQWANAEAMRMGGDPIGAVDAYYSAVHLVKW